MYCYQHGFIPLEKSEPVCCQNCEKEFYGDKKRYKRLIGFGVAIIALFVVLGIIIFVVEMQ